MLQYRFLCNSFKVSNHSLSDILHLLSIILSLDEFSIHSKDLLLFFSETCLMYFENCGVNFASWFPFSGVPSYPCNWWCLQRNLVVFWGSNSFNKHLFKIFANMSYLFGHPLLVFDFLYCFDMYKCQGNICTSTVDLVLSRRLHEQVDTIHCISEPLKS